MTSPKTYIIVNIEDLTDSMVEISLSALDTLRYTLDKSKVILKFSTPFPDVMAGHLKYTHAEILVEVAKLAWQPVL